jgi:hypothetical protein
MKNVNRQDRHKARTCVQLPCPAVQTRRDPTSSIARLPAVANSQCRPSKSRSTASDCGTWRSRPRAECCACCARKTTRPVGDDDAKKRQCTMRFETLVSQSKTKIGQNCITKDAKSQTNTQKKYRSVCSLRAPVVAAPQSRAPPRCRSSTAQSRAASRESAVRSSSSRACRGRARPVRILCPVRAREDAAGAESR